MRQAPREPRLATRARLLAHLMPTASNSDSSCPAPGSGTFAGPGVNLVPGIHVFFRRYDKEDVDGPDNPRNRCSDCSPAHDGWTGQNLTPLKA